MSLYETYIVSTNFNLIGVCKQIIVRCFNNFIPKIGRRSVTQTKRAHAMTCCTLMKTVFNLFKNTYHKGVCNHYLIYQGYFQQILVSTILLRKNLYRQYRTGK